MPQPPSRSRAGGDGVRHARRTVTAGETLGTLDATALSESVSSAQSTLSADEAKLVEDEEDQSSRRAAGPITPSAVGLVFSSTTSTTARPQRDGHGSRQRHRDPGSDDPHPGPAGAVDRPAEGGPDLAQAQSDCTSANTATPAGQATCEAALQTVSADEQHVSKDQTTVSKDETALGQALAAESSGGSGAAGPANGGTPAAGTRAPPPPSRRHDLTAAVSDGAGNTGSGSTAPATAAPPRAGLGLPDTDTPEQIASDQAAIDTAEAD